MKKFSVEREIGGRILRFETGKIAKLASGADFMRDAVVSCVRRSVGRVASGLSRERY